MKEKTGGKKGVIEHLGSITAWTVLTILMTLFSIFGVFMPKDNTPAPGPGYLSKEAIARQTGANIFVTVFFLILAVCSIIGLVKAFGKRRSAITFIKIYHYVYGVIFTLMSLFMLIPVLSASSTASGILLMPFLIMFIPAFFYLGYAIYFSKSERVKQYFIYD